MPNAEITDEFEFLRSQFNNYLSKNVGFDFLNKYPEGLRQAVLYSLLAGGKRLRPVLILCAAKFNNISEENALKLAFALEALHTYSLIHDDLPAMDNDDLRRGMPTSHRKFNEATAILAGDALQAAAFQALASAGASTRAIQYFCEVVGGSGMVGGQFMDMQGMNSSSAMLLRKIHLRKTGRLLEAAISLPFIFMNKEEHQIRRARNFGLRLGVLFQMADDLLDATGNAEQLGKSPGKDLSSDKLTYVKIYGIDRTRTLCRLMSQRLVKRAKILFPNSDFFIGLPEWIITRKK